jgi:NDP-sugar pyrophosphorylase family protein
MKAMVLAAGEGTRLRPFTLTTPKPMLPVAGRPTLEWILAWLRFHDITDIVVNLCRQPDAVTGYFGDGRALGLRLTYSLEATILGTAGGIKHVEHLFRETFVVVYGDVLTDMDLGRLVRFHQSQGPGPHVTLSVCRVPNPCECGIVAMDQRGRVTRFVEKPARDEVFSDLTNAGVLVVDPPVLAHVPPSGFHDISRDLLPKLLHIGLPVFAQPLEESAYLIDMGTPEKYQRAQDEWPTPTAARYMEQHG